MKALVPGFRQKIQDLRAAVQENFDFVLQIVEACPFPRGLQDQEISEPAEVAQHTQHTQLAHSHEHSHSHDHSHERSHADGHASRPSRLRKKRPSYDDMDKVLTTIKQFIRDWSLEVLIFFI